PLSRKPDRVRHYGSAQDSASTSGERRLRAEVVDLAGLEPEAVQHLPEGAEGADRVSLLEGCELRPPVAQEAGERLVALDELPLRSGQLRLRHSDFRSPPPPT